MSEQIEVPSINDLPNDNGMFTEAFVFTPKTNFDHAQLVELMTALNIMMDISAFEPLSEGLKKQFTVLSRDGSRERYGSSRRGRR